MEWLGKPEPRPERHWSDDYIQDGGYARSIDIQAERRRPGTARSAAASARRAPAAAETPLPDIQPGQSVTHSAFGKGMVLSVRPMGGDALIEIAFDGVGVKKLMLKAAAKHLTVK